MTHIAEIISSISSIDNRLRFIPLRETKAPIPTGWQKDTTTVYDFNSSPMVGLACGALSGNVEALDFDLKYDISGKLFTEYQAAVEELSPGLIYKMVVQTTMSGGYHFVYRCSELAGNKKLASRYTTEEERKNTYQKDLLSNLSKLGGDINVRNDIYEQAHQLAEKSMIHDKVRVLIETRGEGGQIACYPSPGYRLVHGDFSNIQEITPEERSILIGVAQSFNEVVKEDTSHEKRQYIPKKNQKGLTPWEDYNERGDVVQLLINHGWSFVYKRGSKIMLRRPGSTTAHTSGNYDEDLRFFSVFTTSTVFEAEKGYRPFAVFAKLECNDDFSLAARKLLEMGYGDKPEDTKSAKVEVRSSIDTADDDLSFLSTREAEEGYISDWINGTFESGLGIGIKSFDKHFRFKRGNLVMTNGVDNTGKSSVIWYLTMLSARLHGWNWVIFSSENKPAAVRKKLIEFYWDIPIQKQNPMQLEEAKKFVYSHFEIIVNANDMYNYMDILNMANKVMKKRKIHGLMIDPYNSLKVDQPKGVGNTYDYHYEAASLMKLWGSNNDVSIYLNLHVGTSGARNLDKEGNIKAPQKADTEFGVMFPNKADEFLTIHRLVQHESDYIYTELHVRKVKEVETGGQATPMYKPLILRPTIGLAGFEIIPEKSTAVVGENAIRIFIDKSKNNQGDLFKQNVVDYSVNPSFNNDLPEVFGNEPSPF